MESLALPDPDDESLADEIFAIETREEEYESASTARLVDGMGTLCDSQGNAILRIRE